MNTTYGLLRGIRPRAGRMILIGDADLAFNQRLWQQGLERNPPIEIGSASNGAQLIDRLNSVTPMALVINLELPGLSVPQFIRAVAAHPTGKCMPIIGLVDAAGEPLQVASQQAGASHILRKPCDLEAIVKACLEGQKRLETDPAPGR